MKLVSAGRGKQRKSERVQRLTREWPQLSFIAVNLLGAVNLPGVVLLPSLAPASLLVLVHSWNFLPSADCRSGLGGKGQVCCNVSCKRDRAGSDLTVSAASALLERARGKGTGEL